MKPGVTGLAQMQLPADTAMADVRAKLAYDLHYVENISLMLDIRISLATGMYFMSEVARIFGKRILRSQAKDVQAQLQNQPTAVGADSTMPNAAFADRELRLTPSVWPQVSKRPAHSFIQGSPMVARPGLSEEAARDMAVASIASSVS